MSVLRRTRARAPKARPKTMDRQSWLRQALLDCFGMDPSDAEAISTLVTSTFAGQEEVSDDTLTTQLRSIFYTLESRRILTFRRFEYQDLEGRTLRGFQWRINPNFEMPSAAPAPPEHDDVYAALPAAVWKRQAA